LEVQKPFPEKVFGLLRQNQLVDLGQGFAAFVFDDIML
jgi:hypothetical protein